MQILSLKISISHTAKAQNYCQVVIINHGKGKSINYIVRASVIF